MTPPHKDTLQNSEILNDNSKYHNSSDELSFGCSPFLNYNIFRFCSPKEKWVRFLLRHVRRWPCYEFNLTGPVNDLPLLRFRTNDNIAEKKCLQMMS